MDDDIRRLKEEFVSNHNGTSWQEIDGILLLPSLCILIHILVAPYICVTSANRFRNHFVQHLTIVAPLLLSLTIFSDHRITMFQAMFCAFVLLLSVSCVNMKTVSLRSALNFPMDADAISNIVSWYRGIVNILTAICILAVDFRIYPRRLAKTENKGTGLMDIFVGSFIMCNAIVSSEVRNENLNRSISRKLKDVAGSIRSTLPLLLLALVRLMSVKLSNYQEHVTEYGIHWNFFMTLALTKILSKTMFCLISPRYSLLVACTYSLLYQYVLSHGLADYILQPGNRQASFLLANREGIFSLIGYMAIYFCGVAIGREICQRKGSHSVASYSVLTLKMLLVCAMSIMTTNFLQQHDDLVVSRRLVNFTFILWTVHHTLVTLAGLFFVGLVMKCLTILFKDIRFTDSGLLMAVNYNGLCYFLIANICTGLVNLFVDTLIKPPSQSLLILAGYLLGINNIITLLYHCQIRIKFW